MSQIRSDQVIVFYWMTPLSSSKLVKTKSKTLLVRNSIPEESLKNKVYSKDKEYVTHDIILTFVYLKLYL